MTGSRRRSTQHARVLRRGLGAAAQHFDRGEEQHGLPVVTQKNARTRVRELMKAEEIDEKEAMKRVAKEMGISKSDVYRELQKDGKR